MDRLVPDLTDGPLLGMLATSYELAPDFVETDFLPAALELGSWSDRHWTSRIALERSLAQMSAATVLVDARRYRGRPRSLRVETVPIALQAGRALHAKITLLVYERAVRLVVGSANLTEQGYRKNREVAVTLVATERRPEHASVIQTAITTLPMMFGRWWDDGTRHGGRRIVTEARVRLEAWMGDQSAHDSWFAWSGATQPALWEQFIRQWPLGESVDRVSVVSPFWSDDAAHGPVRSLLDALGQRGRVRGARLRLLTKSRAVGPRTWRPVLPASYGECRLDDLGVVATAEAVDPEAAANEVDLRGAVGGIRELHAKVVLVEGPRTALVYVGSGNFTRRGWGFLTDPSAANIEAGIILRRSGSEREVLGALLPPTVGNPVTLDGAATSKLALPEPDQPDRPWPSFLRDVVLVPSPDDAACLELVIRIVGEQVHGDWTIDLIDAPASGDPVLACRADPETSEVRRIPLPEDLLRRLLQQQEVRVVWWECPGGREFPINLDAAAREGLPLTPGQAGPNEDQLLAYYQGRITWEDLFPDPDGAREQGAVPTIREEMSGVDTSRIQAYQIREFVEALRGITDDLRKAAVAPGAMRLALRGPVSPLALAREVMSATADGTRTSVAAGFQLLELLSCMAQVRGFPVPERYRAEWIELVDGTGAEILTFLDRLRALAGHTLAGGAGFTRYERTVRRFCRQRGAAW